MARTEISNRINWIDWAKSICMFFVILGHCHIKESQSFIIQYIYSFHIPLFFILSGLLCKKKSLNSIIKDVKYLILPYITYGLILIFFQSFTSHNMNVLFYIKSFGILIMGYDTKIGAIWFLVALFFVKQIYYFITFISKRCNLIFKFIIIISFSLIYIIKYYNINFPFFIDSSLCGLPFFIIGAILRKYIPLLTKVSKRACTILIISTFIISVILSYFNGTHDLSTCSYGNNIFLYYIDSLLGCSCTISICILLNKYKFKLITISSYGTIVIIGINGFFLTALNYYIPHSLGYNLSTYNIFVALIFSIISFVLCYFFIILLDEQLYYPFGLKGKFVKNILKN